MTKVRSRLKVILSENQVKQMIDTLLEEQIVKYSNAVEPIQNKDIQVKKISDEKI